MSNFFPVTILVILKSWDKEYFNTPFNSKAYRATIFWGDIFDTKYLNNLVSKNIVFVPMSDCIHTKKLVWWFRFRNFKTICFSKSLADGLLKHGFRLFNFHYCPKPLKPNIFPKVHSDVRPLNVYFEGELTPIRQKILDKLFKIQKYNIHTSIKNNTHLYLSFDKYKGLDTDFIDAISRGIVPICPNTHNLNDYIIDKKTGFFYRLDLPLFIDFSNILEVRENLMNSIKINNIKWNVRSKKIPSIIMTKNRSLIDFVPIKTYN